MVFKLYKLYETQRSILHIHVSLLFESSLYATSLLRKIFISSCFRLLKEIWRGFSLLLGASSVCFSAIIEAACTPSSASAATLRLPREPRPASLHQAAIALTCVCEDLYFISIYFVHLLARCVLRWLLLCFTSFWLAKGFMGWLYFQIAGETGNRSWVKCWSVSLIRF